MAEEPIPSFLGQPDEVRNKKYDNLLSDLTSQTVGGYSFSNISDAIKEAEVGGDKNATGWPYIFTKSGKTSSAFGPIQITYSTVLDYFVGAGKEKDQLARFRAGDFVAGYSQLPADVKSYLKSFVEQGIKKRNNKKPQDGGAYGNLGIGDISKADHEKYYPFLVGVHIREKKKIAKDDTVPSFVNAHYGSVEHSNEDIKKARTKARNNLQTKVNEALDIEATPTTEADAQLFTELEQYVPATAKPEPSPAVPDAVSKGQPSAERDITIDYEGEMPDVGEDVPLPTIEEKDVAPDTTDAIPTAEPEEKNIFSRAISGVGEFLFGDDDDTPAKPKVDKNEIIRRSLLKELDTSGVPNMNKGGMPMERQMNMFDEGGLFDEGGTVDEQSGNDVPPGSLKEEVRDDIPAQLSEGEFVFPADVVRYWGLEKLMEMRQEAKAGLARMDAMGQMGNSEEATIPDDLPFTLDDLDMDDDPMEFDEGGLVPDQFGITEQPSQFATYNQQPYVAPTIPTGQPIQQQPLQTGFTPLTTPAVPTDGTVVPTFEQLLPTTTGRYDELKEYINNDTGQTMTIPFVDGKPIYPIPEGFVEVKTDEVEAVETPTTVVPTTQTVSPDDDGDSTNDSTGGGILSFGGTAFDGTVTGNYRSDISFQGLTFGQARKRMTAGVGQFFDFKQNKTPELPKGATATITNIKPPGKDPDGRDARVIRAKVQLDSNFFNRNIANTNVSKRQDLVRVLDYIRKKYDREFLNNKDNVINAELTYQTILEEDKRKETAKAVAEAQRTGNFGDRDDSSPTGYTVGSVIDKAIRDAQQTVRDDYDDEAYSDVSVSQADLEAARQSAPTLSQAQASDGNQVSGIAQDTYEDDSAAYADYGSFFDPAPTETKGTPFNEGGLASKKKPKPKNKMKRGGLASKK